MKRKFVVSLFLLVMFTSVFAFAGNSAGSDPLFSFTFSMGGNQGTGLLNATDLGAGQFLVTSGTINVTAGADTGTYSLIAGGPAPFISPSGAFIVDNNLLPAGDPILDVYGLLFGNGSLEINIWGNSPGNYSFYSWDGSGYNVAFAGPGTATAAPVPEPASLALVGSGLLGVAGIARRKMIRRP